MGKTSKMQKTSPKKKATQGADYRRTSPRGHKSSGEIEVNARKRGTGPVGRGGKMIARSSAVIIVLRVLSLRIQIGTGGRGGRF